MGVYQNHQLAFARTFHSGGALQLEWGNSFPAWFQSIPPERMGINGEYDHYGLQKRVEAQFKQQFDKADLARLIVSQRGRVVVLQGCVADEAMLHCLVEMAERVDGCIRVEARWVYCDAVASFLMAT